MFAYCVEELRFSEDAAYKRIQAARAARQFPTLFTALAEGRLHLAAVCLLAPHLKAENAVELIEAATHRPKSEIEELLARRFLKQEVPARVFAISPVPAVRRISEQAAPRLMFEHAPREFGSDQLAPGQVGMESPAQVGATDESIVAGEEAEVTTAEAKADEVKPNGVLRNTFPSPESFLLQLTISKSTRDKLQHALALLSHAVPTGDVAQVVDRALDTLILQLERRKFGATRRQPQPQGADAENPKIPNPKVPAQHTSTRKRHVPAQVRRAVWERDQGQCTFVSVSGTRCKARRFLEFDHIDPVARGGRATVEGMRLRCRAHNQHEAERMFGAVFMDRKRQEARLAAFSRSARDPH